ncbi:zinc finger protein 16-like isoform X2 [Sardina pilchardus]|uniref:zinc finger protein 16-like isoform X2 n=1 Tax=Sardina pilchardus TaxID=27697 RepID=UPI002E11ABDC
MHSCYSIKTRPTCYSWQTDSIPPSLTSLRLLVPPLRLMTAFMWQVAHKQNVEHYEKLESFVCLVTKMVPDLLSHRQKATLVMGLRAKVMLEMCRGDLHVDSQTLKTHLIQIQSAHLTKSRLSEIDNLQRNLSSLILKLLEDPVKREDFFQRVYPVEYGPDFDKALQVLVCQFISRLEQILPIPNFKQVASCISSPLLWEECKQYTDETEGLQGLLQDNCHRPSDDNGLPSIVEDRIILSLSLAHTDYSLSSHKKEPSLDLQSSSSQTHQDNPKRQGFHQQRCHEDDPTLSVEEEEHGMSSEQFEVDHDDDVEIELDLSECEVREKRITEDTSLSDSEHNCGISKGVPLTASTDMADLEDTSGHSHSESFSEKALKETTVPLEEFCGTFPVNGSDQMLQEAPAGTHPGKKVILNANLRAPTEKSSQQIGPLVLSDISNNNQDHGDGTVEEGLLQDAANSQDGPPTRTSVSSAAPAKRLVSQRAKKKCSHCDRCFTHYSTLLMHQRCHSRNTTYQCSQCGLKFQNASLLAVHKLKHVKGPLTYVCTTCGLKLGSVSSWRQHQKAHRGGAHRCAVCDRTFERLSGLMSHMRTHREDSSAPSSSAPSSSVDSSAPASSDPSSSVDSSAPSSSVDLSAPSSSVDSSAPSCFQETPKETEVAVAQLGPAECKFCGMHFSSLLEFESHLMTHKGIRPYLCNQCDKSFATKQGLLGHLSHHMTDKPFLCEVCGKNFGTPTHLKSHLRGSHPTQQHICPYCGKLYSQRGNLNTHIRTHTGERPFLCSTCGKGYISAGDLKVHMRVHTGERPFKCEICDRGFITSSHRLIHLRLHTGERPFSCTACGRGFARRECYKKHMRIHTGETPYKCPNCPKSFPRTSYLKRHREKHCKNK